MEENVKVQSKQQCYIVSLDNGIRSEEPVTIKVFNNFSDGTQLVELNNLVFGVYKSYSLNPKTIYIDDYDISTLCFVANCGLDFKDSLFAKVVKEILKCMISIWGQAQNRNGAEELLQFRQRDEVEELLRREIVEKNTDDYAAIDLLFDDINYPILLNETERFYSDVFKYMQCAYFDNSDHPEKRNDIER